MSISENEANYYADLGSLRERNRIIDLLEMKADQVARLWQYKPQSERANYLAIETTIRQLIANIKVESK